MNAPGWPDVSRAALSDGPADGEAGQPAEGWEAVAPPGRYRTARFVGAGGMGRVEVVVDSVLHREVARKTLRAEADPAQAARALRLMHEARLTARLDHPGIVPVYDGGTDLEGRPWYTMRLIRGRSLGMVVAEAGTAAERLSLVPRVLAACQAVAYAHAVGVLHRDLTPSNVMVGPYGETVVVDWGLARFVDEAEVAEAGGEISDGSLTVVGAVVGTPLWMSPEQARGEVVDRRSDVWALGRILRFSLVGAIDGELPPEVPADLQAIIDKAAAELAAVRYADAGAMVADLEAWVSGRRVAAHSYSTSELLRRLVAAWRTPLIIAGLALVVIVAVAVISYSRTVRERDRAVAAEQEIASLLAQARAEAAVAALNAGDPGQARMLAEAALALTPHPLARGVIAAIVGAGWLPRLEATLPLPDCRAATLTLDAASVACAQAEATSLVDAATGQLLWSSSRVVSVVGQARPGGPIVGLHQGSIVQFGDDGSVNAESAVAAPRNAMTRAPEGVEVVILDQKDVGIFRKDRGLLRLSCEGQSALTMAVGPQGRWFIPCADGSTLMGRGYEPGLPGTMRTAGGPLLRVSAASWLPDGHLLLGTLDAALFRLDPVTGLAEPAGAAPIGPMRRMAMSPDGAVVAIAGETGHIRLYGVDVGELVGSVPAEGLALAWADARRLRVVVGDTVQTWALDGGDAPSLLTNAYGLATLAAGEDGLAWGDGEGWLTVVDWPSGRPRLHTRWQERVLKSVAFDVDGRDLWAVGADSDALVHVHGAEVQKVSSPFGGRRLAALWDGSVVGTSWTTSAWRIWPDGRREPLAAGIASDLLSDQRGERLLVIAERPWLRLMDLRSGHTELLADGDEAGLAAISADGEVVVAARGADLLLRGQTPMFSLPEAPTAMVIAQGRLWTGYVDGMVRVHTLAGEELVAAGLHEGRVSDLAVSPEERLVFSAGWDGKVRVWAAGLGVE